MSAATRVPAGSPLPPGLRLACAVLPVLAAAAIGSAATRNEVPGWYAGLAKPAFNPPDRVFPLAWGVLYVAIAVSLWRLLGAMPRTGPSRRGWQVALAAFLAQLALNMAWTPVFFTAHAIGAALVVIAALLVMLLWTIRLSWRFDRPAAWLLVPYAAWVTFAMLLNAAILRLN